MKRTSIILLLLTALLVLAACSGGGGGTTDKPASNTAAASQTEQSAGSTTGVLPTDASGQTQGDQPTKTSEPTVQPTPTGTPTVQPTPTPVAGSDGLAYSEYYEGIMIQGLGTCEDLDLIIPSHIDGKPVTAIDGDAFRETAIRSVVIPFTVQYIDEDAFINCKSLQTVTFSEGLKSVRDSAFRGCDALKKIELPASLESISNYAFRYCTGLEEVVIHGGWRIGDKAFEDCASLKKLVVEVREYTCQIGSGVFTGCTALESIELGEGVSEIGSWCFSNCSGIQSLILPKSLVTVQACAFQNAKVGQVYYAGSEDEWKSVTVKNSNDALTSAPVKYASTGPEPVQYSAGLRFELNEDGESYKVAGFGECSDEELLIPPIYEGKPVTLIGYRALERNANLKSVTLPDSVSKIDSLAFRGNTALTTVNWGIGLREIDDSAFESCTSLAEAILPEGIERVGANAFFNCTSLGNVTFPVSVKTVESCLLNCSGLGTLTISSPEALDSFQSWGNTLTCDLVIDADVDTLKEKCFDWCNKIRSITVKSPVTNMADKVFNYCKKAAVITLPATLKTVGVDVFYGCQSLTTVNFGGSEAEWKMIEWNESSDYLKNATVVFNYQG